MTEERRWKLIENPKGAEGERFVIIASEDLRRDARLEFPDVPVYTREEIARIKSGSNSADVLRAVQKVKRVFGPVKVVR